MARSSLFSLSFFFLISLFFSITTLAVDSPEVELLPLSKHWKSTLSQKRAEGDDDINGLDLQDFGTFLWGAEAGPNMMVANLTLDFAQDYEAIVDMDDFTGLVKSIDCTAPDLHLEFKSEEAFVHAHQVWEWTNTDDNYTFVLVASARACGPDSRRQPFLVSSLEFDEVANKILMKAEQKTWEDIAVTYNFKITHEPLKSPPALAKRDTMSLASDFSRQLFDIKAGGLGIGVSCTKCGTEGSVNVDFDLETKLKVPVGASMRITPQDIAAAVELALTLSGTLESPWNPGELNVVSIPLVGFNVGGFFKLGVFMTVDVGMEIGDWTGTASATMGARMTIPNTSVLAVNLFGDGDNEITGWIPEFTSIPPTLSAKVEGSAEAFAQAGVEVSAKGLGKGFAVSLDLKMPYIRADFSALASTAGVCGTKQTLGADLHSTIGAELLVSASLNDDTPFFTHTLFDQTLGTLVDQCYPFGPEGDGTGDSTGDVDAGAGGSGSGASRGKGKGKGKGNQKPTGKDDPAKPTSKYDAPTSSDSPKPLSSSEVAKTSSSSEAPESSGSSEAPQTSSNSLIPSSTVSSTQPTSSGFSTSTIRDSSSAASSISGSSVSSSVSSSSSSSSVGSASGFIPRPTITFNTCDLPEIDCYGNFEDFDGLPDLPGLYEDAPLPDVPEETNSTQTNQTETFRARSYLEYRSNILKRDREYKTDIGAAGSITIESLGYPAPGDLFHTGTGVGLTPHGFTYNSNDPADFTVKDAYTRPVGKNHGWVVEHIIELQTIKMFIEAATDGSLSPTIPGQFFQDFWNKPLAVTTVATRPNQPNIRQANFGAKATLNNLIFQALGSSFNRAEFVLCEAGINSIKEKVWSGSAPMDNRRFKTYAEDASKGGVYADLFLAPIKTTLAVYEYLNNAEIARRLKKATANVKIELSNVQHLTAETHDLASLWSSFMVTRLEEVKSNGEKWLKDNIKVAEDAYDTEIKKLKAIQQGLEDDERRLTPAQKEKNAKDTKGKQDKLDTEHKQLKKKAEDADQAVEDQKGRVEGASGAKRKTEAALLLKREREAYDAMKEMNLKGREFNVLTIQGVRFEIKSAQDDLDILAKFKRAALALKMPASV